MSERADDIETLANTIRAYQEQIARLEGEEGRSDSAAGEARSLR